MEINVPQVWKVKRSGGVGWIILQSNENGHGLLCASTNSTDQPDAIAKESLAELLAEMLGNLLNADLESFQQARDRERIQSESLRDPLTGLYNRRGWEQMLGQEAIRFQRYGSPATVISVYIDELQQINEIQGPEKGDEMIRKAGHAIRATLRKQDIVARVRNGKFALLCFSCSFSGADAVIKRLQASLEAVQISVSLGVSACPGSHY